MATTTSTTKIDNIMKKVLSSLTDPRGRIKKDANRKIVFCITHTIKESMWEYLGFAGDNFLNCSSTISQTATRIVNLQWFSEVDCCRPDYLI